MGRVSTQDFRMVDEILGIGDYLVDGLAEITGVEVDDFCLAALGDDDGDTAGGHGFNCGDAKVFDRLGVEGFVDGKPSGVPVDGGAIVKFD